MWIVVRSRWHKNVFVPFSIPKTEFKIGDNVGVVYNGTWVYISTLLQPRAESMNLTCRLKIPPCYPHSGYLYRIYGKFENSTSQMVGLPLSTCGCMNNETIKQNSVMVLNVWKIIVGFCFKIIEVMSDLKYVHHIIIHTYFDHNK